MNEDPVQGLLENVEAQLRGGELLGLLPMLAYVAGREVSLDEKELHGSLRRAMLLLAAGGDPHREPELEGRAVTALAAELDTPERRMELVRGIDELVGRAAMLPRVRGALFELVARPELAWRAFACSLLAEELGDEG